MKAEYIRRLGSHTKIHKGGIAPAGTKHVESHQKEGPRHLQGRTLEHLLKRNLPSMSKELGRPYEVGWSLVPALCAYRYHEIERCCLFGIAGLAKHLIDVML